MPDRSYSLAEGALDIYRMRFPATITPLLEKLICTEAGASVSIVFFQSAHEGRADRPSSGAIAACERRS
jgi:hypothetical protein